MSDININVTIAEETPINVQLQEETLINLEFQQYTLFETGSLGDLEDVSVTNPTKNDLIIYDGEKFINKQVLKYMEDSDEFEISLN